MSDEHPGLQPYLLTRLEWLELWLQSSLRASLTHETKLMLSFESQPPDTILIVVRYVPDVNPEVMNRFIDYARRTTRKVSDAKGWGDWLQIKEDIKMLNE